MKYSSTFPGALTFSFVLNILLFSETLGHASPIVANFSGGTNTTNPDGYTGAAGNGWSAGWVTTTNTPGSVNVTGAISTASPLNSGGDYLSVSVANSSGGTATGFETRQFNGSTGISVTQPITYSWTFSTPSFTTGQFVFLNNVGSAPSGTGGSNTWVISENDSTWTYRDNTTTVSTTMSIVSGSVYKFTLLSDPTSYTYSFKIDNITAGTTYTSPTGINYRNKTGNSDGTYLGYGVFTNPSSTSTFSLDTIAIVPEPGTMGLTVLSAVAGMFLMYRRRKA